ncbi:hypothetical protein GCM10028832_42670 [Streptomyces sparsus]
MARALFTYPVVRCHGLDGHGVDLRGPSGAVGARIGGGLWGPARMLAVSPSGLTRKRQ